MLVWLRIKIADTLIRVAHRIDPYRIQVSKNPDGTHRIKFCNMSIADVIADVTVESARVITQDDIKDIR